MGFYFLLFLGILLFLFLFSLFLLFCSLHSLSFLCIPFPFFFFPFLLFFIFPPFFSFLFLFSLFSPFMLLTLVCRETLLMNRKVRAIYWSRSWPVVKPLTPIAIISKNNSSPKTNTNQHHPSPFISNLFTFTFLYKKSWINERFFFFFFFFDFFFFFFFMKRIFKTF